MKRERDEFDPPPTRAWVYAAVDQRCFYRLGTAFLFNSPRA